MTRVRRVENKEEVIMDGRQKRDKGRRQYKGKIKMDRWIE